MDVTFAQTLHMQTGRKYIVLGLSLACAACSSAPLATQTVPATAPTSTTAPTTVPTVNRWEREINAYLEEDRIAAPAQGGIVFVGSSSIRGWRSLAKDFPDLPVIGRGFGGSQSIDVLRYTDVLVLRHRPRTVVFYCGENDIASRLSDPQGVLRHFQTFVDLVHRELPETRIVFISLKPSPSRMAFIESFREANSLVKRYVETDPRLSFVNVFDAMLDENGAPREALYLSDRLHMTRAGYALWTELVRPHLD